MGEAAPAVTAGDPLAVFRDLRDRTLRDGAPSGSGPLDALFIAESLQVVQRVLGSGLTVERVVVSAHGRQRLGAALDPLGDRVHVLPDEELAGLAGFPVHRGVLAAVHRPAELAPADVLRGARTVAVLEDLNDPENLGALIRSAVALGIDGLLLSPRCTDPLYRRTVRVSMGEVLRLPWARLRPWPDGLRDLPANGFPLVGLSSDGTVPLARWAAGLAAGERVALLLGGEANGLSAGARVHCSTTVRITMRTASDSLNVAAAAAIAFHAAARLGEPDGPAG